MGSQLLGVAKSREQLEPAARAAAAAFGKIGLAVTAKEPDLDKLEALMAKAKAEVKFLLFFDGTSVVYYVRVASTEITLASLVLANAGRLSAQRSIIEKLVKNSKAADPADLDRFDKAHPPPTQEEWDKLDRALKTLEPRLHDKLSQAKKLDDEIKAMQAQVRSLRELAFQYIQRKRRY